MNYSMKMNIAYIQWYRNKSKHNVIEWFLICHDSKCAGYNKQ